MAEWDCAYKVTPSLFLFLVEGSKGIINSGANTTKTEVAVLLYRIYNKY